jgi:tRNA A37 threonylcarbamoyladenosine biosynthesis protein TsaE
MFSEPHNIVIIEWADKFKKLLPKNTIWIELAHGAKDGVRSAKVKGI